MPVSSYGSFPTGSQRRPGAIELIEKTRNWRKPAVALDDDRQRLRGEAAEFGQKRKHFWGYVVQVVVEQTTSPVWPVDPSAATQVHGGDPIEGQPAKE
jgi:hypothetical protein